MDFLDEANLCGRALLRIVARGSSIIAELHRLAERIPPFYLGVASAETEKYAQVLFDFKYLKAPELYERRIAENLDLVDIDDELQETHLPLLERFYTLFENMYKYMMDFQKYLEDLESGFYISNTVEHVLLDPHGKQLMCEAVYLMGVMLLQLDEMVPGPTRERLVVSYMRYTGEGSLMMGEEVTKLVRSTGFLPGMRPKPENYPSDFFARFAPDKEVLGMIIDRLRSDDVYQRTRMFPSPDHRSAALSQQASMLYVILYFVPEKLHRDQHMMREIVDKHFNDNWVIQVHMGRLADLTEEWAPYRAATEALLMDALQAHNFTRLVGRSLLGVQKCEEDLKKYLTEGVLTQQYVIDNINPLLNCLRGCNTTLRWALLHKRTTNKRYREALLKEITPSDRLLQLLLNTAQLEFKLKQMFAELLANKQEMWEADKKTTSEMMVELSDYFSGEAALTRVEKDEQLQGWFRKLATEIEALDYGEATAAGRKIQQLIKALEDIEQFETIDTSTYVKEFLHQARTTLLNMVRTVNVKEEVMDTLLTVSDFAYAWDVMGDYMREMHERITRDPGSVVLLRAVFLKLTSVLDVPLIRIKQAASPDAESVSEFYSTELVSFVRRVLEIVPISVFKLLADIIALQTRGIVAVPVKLELAHLKQYAQAEERYTLAQLTHRISVFTEGILAMHKTLLGDIQVDPRQILEDGIRKELVRQVSGCLHDCLQFDMRGGRGRDPKAEFRGHVTQVRDRLQGFQRSFAYIQDYIDMYGLKIWQEEFSRVIGFNVEAECNKYLKRKVLDFQSRFQSKTIPVPVFNRVDRNHNFMGRLTAALCALTDPRYTISSPTHSGWFDASGREVAGLALFDLMSGAMSVAGLCGVDRLLSFQATAALKEVVARCKAEFKRGAVDLLKQMSTDLRPLSSVAPSSKVYDKQAKKLARPMDEMLDLVLCIGQVQLLRKHIAAQLNFSCQLDSKLLHSALEAINTSVVNDIRRHYFNASKYSYPNQDKGTLVKELGHYLEAAGIYNPFCQIYVTMEAQPHIALWLVLFVLSQMPKLVYDRDFASLVRRRASDPLDGAPLVAGVATVLKQLHPTVTRQFLAYLGQYVRTQIFACFASAKPSPLPAEVVNTLLFAQMLCEFAVIPRRVVDGFFPPYIFDAVAV